MLQSVHFYKNSAQLSKLLLDDETEEFDSDSMSELSSDAKSVKSNKSEGDISLVSENIGKAFSPQKQKHMTQKARQTSAMYDDLKYDEQVDMMKKLQERQHDTHLGSNLSVVKKMEDQLKDKMALDIENKIKNISLKKKKFANEKSKTRPLEMA